MSLDHALSSIVNVPVPAPVAYSVSDDKYHPLHLYDRTKGYVALCIYEDTTNVLPDATWIGFGHTYVIVPVDHPYQLSQVVQPYHTHVLLLLATFI